MTSRIEMKGKLNKSYLDQLVKNVITKKYIYGAVFYVSSNDNSIDLISASENIKEDSQYYIASINKFFCFCNHPEIVYRKQIRPAGQNLKIPSGRGGSGITFI